MSKNLSRFPMLAIAALLVGCTGPQPVSPTVAPVTPPTVEALLPALANNVILPVYQELDDKADVLDKAVQELAAAPSDARLETARQAWRAARAPWELSESHLFGPVADQELDPALDSWPVNKTDLDAVLASNVTLDAAFIASQQPTLKGFHVIEYVLFGNQAADLTERKLAYLKALSTDFRGVAAKLRQAWEPTGGNFIAQFSRPSADGAFGTAEVAFAETLNAMAEICEEVATGKIETPLAANDPTLEESHFSGNSLEDFRLNIQGVQNMYLGRYGSRQGLGLSSLVAAKNPELDSRMRQLLDQALADLQAVPGTYAEAIVKNPESLRKVQTSINAVKKALQQEVNFALTGKVAADAT